MRAKILISTLVVCLAASAALGQQIPSKEMMLGRKIFTALRADAKAELKVTEDQLKKIFDAFEGALTVDGNRIMMSLSGDMDVAGMERAAMKVLDDNQRKRLEEIWIQNSEGLAVADDAIAKKLALSSSQIKQIDKLLDEGADKLMDLYQGQHEPNPEIPKKAKVVRADIGKRVLALLTDEQAKAYEAMKGKPFKPAEKKDGGAGGLDKE